MSTRDPLVWAEEFCRIFQGKTIGGPVVKGDVDEGAMVTWFANAMQVALDLHNQEVDEAEAEPDLIEMTPIEEADDEEPPTLEEKFKEGFDEGR
jgi:hypothetical protein